MADYSVGPGQTRFGLVLHPNDTATVASGGTILGTVDGGAVTLNGGRSIFTAILGGGSERIGNNGSAFGTLIENGGSLSVSDVGSMSGTLIETGGSMNLGNYVNGTGFANGTVINGGSEGLFGSSTDANDVITNGGVQALEQQLAVVRNAVVDKGGVQSVLGQTFGTVVNNGGLQDVRRGDGDDGIANGTIINNGGKQLLDGGYSRGAVINPGGVQDNVDGGAQGTVINGGTMLVEPYAETVYLGVTGGILFTGQNGVLELGGTSLTTTPISGFAPTDRIDFLNFGFSNTATATLGANNVLTIQGLTGGTATLMLDPTANYGGESFKLASDGHGGTNLTVQTLGDVQAAASAQGDPLGLQAAFTKTAPATAVPAATSGMTPPDPVAGSADAFAVLTQASAHVLILASHDMATSG